MVTERPWYIPRKCNASFLLCGVCWCTLRLQCAARFVLRIILSSKASPPHRLVADEGAMPLEQMERIESPLEVKVNEGLSVCATDLD